VAEAAQKFDLHHTYLKSLGGDPKQDLTELVDYLHTELHSDLRVAYW
jgi:hypothetical protein